MNYSQPQKCLTFKKGGGKKKKERENVLTWPFCLLLIFQWEVKMISEFYSFI
jgi:hypothetical protein